MFFTDWRLTLISLAPFPVLDRRHLFFQGKREQIVYSCAQCRCQLNAFVQEHITGMHVVQAFAAEEKESNKFRKINREHRNANINAIFAYSVFFPVVEIVLAVGTGLMVWWAAKARSCIVTRAGSRTDRYDDIFYSVLNLLVPPIACDCR